MQVGGFRVQVRGGWEGSVSRVVVMEGVAAQAGTDTRQGAAGI